MKLCLEIGGSNYIFELDRSGYKRMLLDKEFMDIQSKLAKEENQKEKDISSVYVEMEKVFYYSLLKNQPYMTTEKSSELLNVLYDETGSDELFFELTGKLLQNFTQQGTTPKVKKTFTVM